jgi:hypothetical protein
VVGVRVAAVLVVRRHHVWPERADQADQRLGRNRHVHQTETALRQRGQRIALGQAGVDPAQPVLPDTEDLARGVHLAAAHLGQVGQHGLVVLQLRVEDRTALSPGAGDDVHIDALGDIADHAGRAFARLVVGMGVDRHQPQLLAHGTIIADDSPDAGCEVP